MMPKNQRVRSTAWKNVFAFALMLFTTAAHAQKVVIGKVSDSTSNQPLSGISVHIRGDSTVAVTDDNGAFSLNVPNNATELDFSGGGYYAKTVAISGRSDIGTVLLHEQVTQLEQVVVVGYGTQKKKDVTGAVSVVNMGDVKAQPAASPVEALQGKALGVQIINDGSPGATPQIRIRGNSTINNNDPLYIIDGMPFTGNLSWLNSNDIESMQVLKDASAASIYGSRANNGVVIVTTKKGRKNGEPKVSLDMYYGTQRPNKGSFPQFMTPMQYAEYQYAAWNNANVTNDPQKTPGLDGTTGSNYGSDPNNPTLPEYLLAGSVTGQKITADDADPSKYRYTQDASTFYQITKANQSGTDWFDAITHAAPIQNYQLGILGGGENSSYAVGGGYLKQDGIIKYTGFKRYNLRANTSFTVLNGRLNLGENFQYSYDEGYGFATNVNVPGQYIGEGSPIGWAYRIQTIIPVYDIMGNFAGTKGDKLGNAENPLAVLYRAKDNKSSNSRFFGNAFADLTIIDGLNLRTSYGVGYNNYRWKTIGYPNPEFSEGNYTNNPLTEGAGYTFDGTWTNTATFKHRFNNRHDLTVMVGSEAVKHNEHTLTGTGNGFFVFGDLNYYYLAAATTNKSPNSYGGNSRLFSLFGRVDYAFMDKYLLSATIRRDGSSVFGPLHKYGNFPAASIAWRVSKEKFMQSIRWIDDLKLRAGYGETGNQSIPAFQYLRLYQSTITQSSYPINGTALSSGVWTNSYDNPDIKWEALKSWNVGLDFTLFGNVLDGTFDVYNKKTSDMLYPVPLPSQAVGGGGSPWVNVGTMSNNGFEVALTYHYLGSYVTKDAFKFDLGVSLSRNVNKVVELAPTVSNQIMYSVRSLSPSILMPGQPMGAFYGYKVTGIYQSQEDIDASPHYDGARVGGLKYADVSGADGTPDGVVDANDRTIIGNPYPKFIYSINFNASYKNFDVLMFFNGSYKNQIFDATRYYTDFNAFDGAISTRLLDAWSTTNTGSSVPSPYKNPSSYELASNSYYVQDGSYLRMKNIQIGYTFSSKNQISKYIRSFRVYLGATNLFTITNYSGLDPEVSSVQGTYTAPGVDLGVYPAARQYMFGVNVTF
ncbi:MAG: TonB-dependent receptor [Chitinophagaceae bacterium]